MTQPPENQATFLSSKYGGTLDIQLPDGKTIQVPLVAAEIKIGRASQNDLVLEDATVSRQHAVLTIEQDKLFLTDLGSSNGSYIAGQRVSANERVVVPAGAPFQLGDVKLVFLPVGAAAPQAQKPEPDHSPAVKVPKQSAKAAGIAAGLLSRLRTIPLAGGVIGGIVLVLLCVGTVAGAAALRNQRARPDPTCNQDPMALLFQGGNIYSASALQGMLANNPQLASGALPAAVQAGDLEPLVSTAFLEIPFPYDGGNQNFGGSADQFRQAIQRNAGTGGRVNSFFDHLYPLYPAPKDPGAPGGKEPPETPIGEMILPFDGQINPYFAYSGHPALDFSTFEYRQPTTPVFAAADGVVYAAGTHGASGALYVKIRHTVEGVGDFLTVYWHLHPDPYFDAMLDLVGQPIKAGTRIGTMGNTGFSTGHHLHFEIRFDLDGDGAFSGTEVVDPFGWLPSSEYPQDPWSARSGMVSRYLWKVPLGSAAVIPESGGGQMSQPGGTGGEFPVSTCAQPGTLPPGGTYYYSWAPDPNPSPTTVGVGQGCVLAVFDADGQSVGRFNNPVKVILPFDQTNLSQIDPQTMEIYWQTEGSQDWQPLETWLDQENQVAVAFTQTPGKCALMGKPTSDILPPTTEIALQGVQAPDGAFYDEVFVTIKAKDQSRISQTLYSLDNGDTWQEYSAPFSVKPSGIPDAVVMDEEFFGGLPGSFVVLAASIDEFGNAEEPPSMAYFSIDPTKNPEAKPLDRPKLVFAPTNTPEPTLSPLEAIQVTTTPTSTATLPPPVMGPDTYPEGIDPLTGLPCSDPGRLNLPPAMISVTNFPVTARPQAGLSSAAYVFELYIGEGMTRFLSLFHCDFPSVVSNDPGGGAPTIGPIRSGRLPYESLRKLYNGFLVMASASAEVGVQLGGATNIFGSDENDVNSALIDVTKLVDIAQKQSLNLPQPNLTGNLFDSSPPAGGQPAEQVWVFYNFLNQTNWVFDAASGAYLRFQDNADGKGDFYPSTDRLNGEQLAYENVIVLYADHTVLNSEGTLIDIDLFYQLDRAYLFRDGRMFPIYWTTIGGEYEKTTGRLRPLRFVDKDGNPFPLKPGQVWVELVDMSTTLVELDPGYWKVRFYAP